MKPSQEANISPLEFNQFIELLEKPNIFHRDKLLDMFERQRKFQIFLGSRFKTGEVNYEELRIAALAIIAELGEILEACQGWKPWRKNPPPVDRNHLLEELADIWHFIINLTLFLGYSPEQLYNMFVTKNATNWKRQAGGY